MFDGESISLFPERERWEEVKDTNSNNKRFYFILFYSLSF